jgi:antirestriction protein ArdC
MRDLYDEVTKRIIAALEAGTPPWIRPWAGNLERSPVNGLSRRPYRGINRVLLTLEAQLRGFKRNVWLTYRQATELTAQVRGGEPGARISARAMRRLRTREAGGVFLQAAWVLPLVWRAAHGPERCGPCR